MDPGNSKLSPSSVYLIHNSKVLRCILVTFMWSDAMIHILLRLTLLVHSSSGDPSMKLLAELNKDI